MGSASTKFAGFFDFLRSTGTELPISNAEMANFLQAAIDELDIDTSSRFVGLSDIKIERLKVVQDNLSADLEVLIESLNFMEDEDGDDEAEEEAEDE